MCIKNIFGRLNIYILTHACLLLSWGMYWGLTKYTRYDGKTGIREHDMTQEESLESKTKITKKKGKLKITFSRFVFFCIFMYLYSAQYLHILQDSKHYLTHLTAEVQPQLTSN